MPGVSSAVYVLFSRSELIFTPNRRVIMAEQREC